MSSGSCDTLYLPYPTQAKLQKAQQQREYAKAFHADVVRKLAAEESERQEAAAARSRLASLRNRLSELKGLKTDSQGRAHELQEQVAVWKVRARCCMASFALHYCRDISLGVCFGQGILWFRSVTWLLEADRRLFRTWSSRSRLQEYVREVCANG